MSNIIDRMESEVRGYVRQYPTVFSSARGATIIDDQDRHFIDFFAGAGALNYGHNNPRSKQALVEYIESNGLMHSLDMASTAKVDFLRAFEEIILRPRGLDYKVQFTGPTGTNSVEAAIKLARKHKQRSHIVAFTNAYHGHTLGSLALTANEYYHSEFYGSHNNVTHLPFDGYIEGVNSAELLERMLDDPSSGLPKPAAVIFETIQCEGGINVASTEWLRSVVEICQSRDILVIVDDIQVGNGRTGSFFSFEQHGFTPDMVCLSKSIGGGLPMAMVLIDPACDAWSPGEHTGTFRGNNLAFVSSKALLEYWRDTELEKHVKALGEIIHSRLTQIASLHPRLDFNVRGRGMVWGIDVHCGEAASKIVKLAFDRGLIVETAGADGRVLKLLPPLTISAGQLEQGLSVLQDCMGIQMGKKLPVTSVSDFPVSFPIGLAK